MSLESVAKWQFLMAGLLTLSACGADKASEPAAGQAVSGVSTHAPDQSMVTTSDIKAGVIWADTVASHAELLKRRSDGGDSSD